MNISNMNKTTGENGMVGVENGLVGVGLSIEEIIKQEPTYLLKEVDSGSFSANNDHPYEKSEDDGNHFSANNDPLNIKSEQVDIFLDNEFSRTVGLNMVPRSTKNNMVGEIIEGIDNIKQESNGGALVEETSQTSSGSFDSHANTFDTSSVKPTCEICGSTFASRRGLTKHQIIHKNRSEVRMHKCQNCAFETKHKSYLNEHNLIRHGNLKKFSCERCDYKTNVKHSLKKHLIQHTLPLANPKDEKDYKCESCKFTTKNEHNMERHSKVHKLPSELNMMKCHLCPYQSRNHNGLANHILCHKSPSETTIYKCELCSYKSKWRHCLRNHIKTHENKSEHVTIRKCEICEFTTNNIYSLETHMKSHSVPLERPKSIYNCYNCGYHTSKKYRLVSHMSIHNSDLQLKLLECAVCGYRSKSKYGLRNHVVLVHGPLANVNIKPNF